MQSQSKLFDDLARVANGAVSTLMGMKEEIDAMVQHRFERFIANADLVSRDEFDAVKAMAANAREENEQLSARIATLEATVAKLSTPSPARKRAAASKSSTSAQKKPARKPAAKASKS